MVMVLARNWWALVLRGFFDVSFGVTAFVWPGITLAVLVLLYGAFALVDGSFAIAAVLVGRTRGMPSWALLVEGLAGIAVGAITFFWPGITQLALLFLIAAWAVVTGVFEIVAAVRLRKEIRGEWLLALSGVLSVAVGVALVVNPGAGLLAISWMIGTYAIIFGVLFIVLGFRLRSWLQRESFIAITPSGEPTTTSVPGTVNIAR
jgi:uncharacterized membrane protein HdeD (DUF308 family)